MESKSGNIEFMLYDNANEALHKLCESRLLRYQIDLEASIKRSRFIFESVQLIYYKCHRIDVKRGSSYTDYPDWIKKKKSNNKPTK